MLMAVLFFHKKTESFSEKGIKTPLAPSLYGEGAFFASPLTYHFFYTCNSWIAEMMKKAGYKSFPLISQHPACIEYAAACYALKAGLKRIFQ